MECRGGGAEGRPCTGLLTIFFDVDNDDVLWFCPVCNDEGRIGGWQDTFLGQRQSDGDHVLKESPSSREDVPP
jgi:hypothetical protein